MDIRKETQKCGTLDLRDAAVTRMDVFVTVYPSLNCIVSHIFEQAVQKKKETFFLGGAQIMPKKKN